MKYKCDTIQQLLQNNALHTFVHVLTLHIKTGWELINFLLTQL